MRPARPPVPLIIDMRRRRRTAGGALRSHPGGFGCSLLSSLVLVALTVFATLVYASVTADLPSLETIPALLQPPDGLLLKPTQLFDRSGKYVLETLSYPGAEKRSYISFASALQKEMEGGASAHSQIIPSALISATLITRDPQFWEHAGYSLEGISQGAHPTLAQALASDLLLWPEPPGFRRALRERLLARQITAEYGREQVLEWYLNSAQYGPGIFGAETAAQLYFGVSASELSLAQAAAMAAAAQAPALNPFDAPQANLENQQRIIQMLRERNWISDETAAKARKEQLNVLSRDPQMASPNLAFTHLVIEQLSGFIDRARLERGGFRVITSLDYDLQQQAVCTARVQLNRLMTTDPDPTNIEGDDPQCQAARLLPTLPSAALHDLDNTYANIVALDPRTGEVLALVGDTTPGQNPAAGIGQPPGTLLAPFIYLAAFTRGFSPASLVWDVPAHLNGLELHNFNGNYQGPMRLRNALANDRLAPLAYILTQVGPENVWAMTRQIGLFQVDPAAAPASLLDFLMATRLTLLQASRAFGIFANQGILAGLEMNPSPSSEVNHFSLDKTNAFTFSAALAPALIIRVEDASGSLIQASDASQSRAVISPQLAFLVTQVLSDETARWPSLGHPNPLEIGRPAAVKIGQTLDGSNAWTIGALPQLVVGVRIGKGESGETAASSLAVPANAAAGLWHALTQYASRSLPYESWTIPPGISIVDVCDPSGLLPTADCPSVVSEYFLAGNEPTQTDNLYRAVQINRETNRLATVFTPVELIEERVFLAVPPEAAEWARQAGLPIPPEAYDVISPPQPSPNARITQPEMLAYVRGQVQILGTASGPDFAYYRVQVGKGLNPNTWLQVGEDNPTPIQNGQLAIWDTGSLSGLYTLQLLTVRTDQRIEKAVVQVTVDNHPPLIQVTSPTYGQEIKLAQRRIVTLRAYADDDLGLRTVAFFIDGQLLASLNQAPFSYSWTATPGGHVFRATATDLAGNTSQTEILFQVR